MIRKRTPCTFGNSITLWDPVSCRQVGVKAKPLNLRSLVSDKIRLTNLWSRLGRDSDNGLLGDNLANRPILSLSNERVVLVIHLVLRNGLWKRDDYND